MCDLEEETYHKWKYVFEINYIREEEGQPMYRDIGAMCVDQRKQGVYVENNKANWKEACLQGIRPWAQRRRRATFLILELDFMYLKYLWYQLMFSSIYSDVLNQWI